MWRNYLSAAVGHLARNRVYAGVGVLTLALGLTVAVLVGVFLRHELSYDRFLPDHERLFLVEQVLTPPGNGEPWRSYPIRTDISGLIAMDIPQVEAVTRLAPAETIVRRGNVQAVEEDFGWADPNLFDVLKLSAIAGDLRTALQAPDGIVLTRGLARKYFGRDDPVGETLTLRSIGFREGLAGPPRTMRVTAVLEDLPATTHLKVKAFASALAPDSVLPAVDHHRPTGPFGQVAFTYVRLRPGVSSDAVRQAFPGLVARRIPAAPLMGSRIAFGLIPVTGLHLPATPPAMAGAINSSGDPAAIAAVAAVGASVLLTAAVNFVGLTTARAARRSLEVGVRKTAGARRADLMAQFMGETLIQVAAALILALALAELTAPSMGALLSRPLGLDYADLPLMAMVLGATLFVGLAAGFYPALVLSGFRPAAALKGGLGGPASSAAMRELLVAGQFAVLVLLMLGVATLYRQTALALDQAKRFGGEQVLWISEPTLCSDSFRDRVRAMSGVRDSVCSTNVVFINGGATSSATTQEGQLVSIELGPVDFGFFEFYGLTPVAGRLFTPERPADGLLRSPGAEGDPPVILNEAAVRKLGFASPQAAVGQTLRWERLSWSVGRPAKMLPNRPAEIVGVVPDYAMGTSREPVRPMVFWIDPAFAYVLSVKVDGADVPGLLRALDDAWRGSGQVRPMRREFMDEAVERTYRDVIALRGVIAVCAGLALLVACIGLFALSAYTAERRTKEIGVRKAMGASTGDILRLLLWQFARPVLWANLIAWPSAYLVLSWWLRGFADRVTLDLWMFAAATAVAVAIAWTTVFLHALRVAGIKPVDALRYE